MRVDAKKKEKKEKKKRKRKKKVTNSFRAVIAHVHILAKCFHSVVSCVLHVARR